MIESVGEDEGEEDDQAKGRQLEHRDLCAEHPRNAPPCAVHEDEFEEEGEGEEEVVEAHHEGGLGDEVEVGFRGADVLEGAIHILLEHCLAPLGPIEAEVLLGIGGAALRVRGRSTAVDDSAVQFMASEGAFKEKACVGETDLASFRILPHRPELHHH